MANHSPNSRIKEAERKGDRIQDFSTTPRSGNPDIKGTLPRPMPGIIILVHGVNDVGEAYATQARALCEGLNLRLERKDLTPGDWDTPRACGDSRRAGYQRRADSQGYNPIIPFYWGYRPVDKATYEADQARYKEELRKRGPAGAEAPYDAYYVDGRQDPAKGYQNMDCFNNYLDEHFAKNGGVFANATTNLADLWGPGGDILGLARSLSTFLPDMSHPVYKNPHRIYFVWAAQRLANLIIRIRRESPQTQDDSINLVAHSQGTLISLLANFLVATAKPAVRAADCLILNHSPYSLETPTLEALQSVGPQQSRRAREETLANLCRLIDAQRQAGPPADKLVASGIAAGSVKGKPLHLHDNHGKVFNYFCPHDLTVSLENVQGIGWQGISPEVAGRLGGAFVQRMFHDGRPFHAAPGAVPLPDINRPGVLKKLTNAGLPAGASRNLNAPQLPDFGKHFALPAGCATLGPSDWDVYGAAAAGRERNVTGEIVPDALGLLAPLSPPRPLSAPEVARLEAALQRQGKPWRLAAAARSGDNLVVERYLTPEELETKARNTRTDNSNHSAIVLSADASRYATAFDLAIGRCNSYDFKKIDGGKFWQELLNMADWRYSTDKDDKKYYSSGILPKEIKDVMNKPPAIPGLVNESTATQATSSKLRQIDERIAQLEKEKDRWPKREWEECLRNLQRQRKLVEGWTNRAHDAQSLFPVAHVK